MPHFLESLLSSGVGAAARNTLEACLCVPGGSLSKIHRQENEIASVGLPAIRSDVLRLNRATAHSGSACSACLTSTSGMKRKISSVNHVGVQEAIKISQWSLPYRTGGQGWIFWSLEVILRNECKHPPNVLRGRLFNPHEYRAHSLTS